MGKLLPTFVAGVLVVAAACNSAAETTATDPARTVAVTSTTTTSSVVETTTTMVEPDYDVLADGSLLFKGEALGLPEWFGGIQLGIRDFDGNVIGTFSDSTKGPSDFYNALLMIVQIQGDGRYGSSVEEVESYLENHDGTVKIRLIEPSDEIGNAGRIPPDVQVTDELTLDLTKPVEVKLVKSTPPGTGMIPLHIGSNAYWLGFGLTDGQLTFFDRMYRPNTQTSPDYPYDLFGFSNEIFLLMESLSRAGSITDATYRSFFEDIGSRLGEAQFGKNPELVNLDIGDFFQLSGSLADPSNIEVVSQMFSDL